MMNSIGWVCGCFLKRWVSPHFTPQWLIILEVGKPSGFVGETHQLRKPPYSCWVIQYMDPIGVIIYIYVYITDLPPRKGNQANNHWNKVEPSPSPRTSKKPMPDGQILQAFLVERFSRLQLVLNCWFGGTLVLWDSGLSNNPYNPFDPSTRLDIQRFGKR